MCIRDSWKSLLALLLLLFWICTVKKKIDRVNTADALALLESSRADDPLNLLKSSLALAFRRSMQLHTDLGVLSRMKNLG